MEELDLRENYMGENLCIVSFLEYKPPLKKLLTNCHTDSIRHVEALDNIKSTLEHLFWG
jgi:hypothetical protein